MKARNSGGDKMHLERLTLFTIGVILFSMDMRSIAFWYYKMN